MDEAIWDHSVYSKNRERILHNDLAVMVLRSMCSQAEAAGLLSGDHFTVDCTLIETWASLKSFRAKDVESPVSTGGNRNPEIDFHGEKRRNDTHASVTDPESRLFGKGKGKEANLCFIGHVLMDNRHGLAVDIRVTQATGTAEREVSLSMAADISGVHQVTIGADKGYGCKEFVDDLRSLAVTRLVAQAIKGSAIDGRPTRHEGYMP